MMYRFLHLLTLPLVVIFFFVAKSYALTITNVSSPQDLVDTIVDPSSITITNVSFTGTLTAVGLFSGGNDSGLDINSGIILTTGSAQGAIGPNDSDSYSVDNGLAGDSDLDALVSPYETYDATVLEFDFTTSSGDLYFNFIFASEEYEEYVNSEFNDVFAFYVDGVNIALIPNTSEPITVNTVNQLTNSEYYVSNVSGDYDIQYDGFTTVLTASILGLSSGTHHMKIAIADTSDHIYDSAVFIEAGTFSGYNPEPVPEPSTALLVCLGLFIMGAMIARKKIYQ